jgi:hypothetical protein
MNFTLVKEEQVETRTATDNETNAPVEPAGGKQTEGQ